MTYFSHARKPAATDSRYRCADGLLGSAAAVPRALLYALLLGYLGGCATHSSSVHPPGVAPPGAAPNGALAAPAPLDLSAVLVERAAAMLGQPYRFGGAAPGGFDCSGLVTYAAGGAGIAVPRTAEQQLHAGVPIARAQLKAGDLVFLRLLRKELHVGISVDGTRFIHAPSTGGYVRIDSLAAPPYAHSFVAARRIVEATPPSAALAPRPAGGP